MKTTHSINNYYNQRIKKLEYDKKDKLNKLNEWIEKMKALKDLLEEKSDDWIVENLLPRHIKWGTRTIIRRSDINWKHLRTKVKYVWYCWPMLIRNFCIDYKKNWWQFDEAVEAWILYRSV